MTILGVIPARYDSSRFPGKPLAMIHGKTMIQRVYEQALKCHNLSTVVVATDDERIFDHVQSFGGEVVLTSADHQSGTERCAEVVRSLSKKYEVVINIQGDEPYVSPNQIAAVCSCFTSPNVDIATLKKQITTTEELQNPNRPKVAVDKNGFALMFSRLPIPVLANIEVTEWLNHQNYFKHIGIYGYKSDVLLKIAQLNESPLEKEERLEQLRWLENGYKIKVAKTTEEAIAIDTPEDLNKLNKNEL